MVYGGERRDYLNARFSVVGMRQPNDRQIDPERDHIYYRQDIVVLKMLDTYVQRMLRMRPNIQRQHLTY